jgi:hypothetical protein
MLDTVLGAIVIESKRCQMAFKAKGYATISLLVSMTCLLVRAFPARGVGDVA